MFEHERKSLGQTRVFPIWRQSIVAFVAGNTKERNDYVLVVVIACNLKPPKKQNRKEEETYAEKKDKDNQADRHDRASEKER